MLYSKSENHFFSFKEALKIFSLIDLAEDK